MHFLTINSKNPILQPDCVLGGVILQGNTLETHGLDTTMVECADLCQQVKQLDHGSSSNDKSNNCYSFTL